MNNTVMTKQMQSALSNLLAVIHGDGGHYEDQHGTEKALKDALEVIYEKFRPKNELPLTEVDVKNLPSGRVLAKNDDGRYLIGTLIRVEKSNVIMCNDRDYSGNIMFNITHYIQLPYHTKETKM